MARADLAPFWGLPCGKCADLGVHPRRDQTHTDLRAYTSELHRSREALSRARRRAPIWGGPRRSDGAAPIWGLPRWNLPVPGAAPKPGHLKRVKPCGHLCHKSRSEPKRGVVTGRRSILGTVSLHRFIVWPCTVAIWLAREDRKTRKMAASAALPYRNPGSSPLCCCQRLPHHAGSSRPQGG